MRETAVTNEEKEIMELARQVRKIIKTHKQWVRFREYMAFYYKKLPSHLDLIRNKTK